MKFVDSEMFVDEKKTALDPWTFAMQFIDCIIRVNYFSKSNSDRLVLKYK